MKKVLFLIQGEDMPSSRVRVLNLLDKLKDKSYDIFCRQYPKSTSDKLKLFTSLKNYDIVFLQKKAPFHSRFFFL